MQPSRRLYVATSIIVVVLMLSAHSFAQSTENVLYTFTGGSDGASPSTLIFDGSGNLYGAAYAGGNLTSCFGGCGTIFKLTPGTNGWTESTIYTFSGGSDGSYPFGALVFDAAGNLYGTTGAGGDLTDCAPSGGCGTVYILTPTGTGAWTHSVLHSFKGGSDGKWPLGGIVFDAAGNLYGTTEEGGGQIGGSCSYGCGTVFQLTPTTSGNWRESVIHVFGDNSKGANPGAGLIIDSAGSLYGTTYSGGNFNDPSCGNGCGLVFRLASSAGTWRESVLHAFTGGNDGGNPLSSVTFDSAGNLYGTTFSGGGVFKLTHGSKGGWIEATIHSFGIGWPHGGLPEAGVVFDLAGNLYGTTSAGGGQGSYGTVFELTPSSKGWTQNVLHTFTGSSDGGGSQAALTLDAAGNLYGSTSIGGVVNSSCPYGCGVVFEMTTTSSRSAGHLSSH